MGDSGSRSEASSCWPRRRKLGGTLLPADVNNGLAWFVLSFAIFNTYMMLWALRVNLAVFGVFLTLEITEILLTIGYFRLAHGDSAWMLHAGGWAGIVTAAVAWYASAAGVINGMSATSVLPVGQPLWDRLPLGSRQRSPMPRERAA
jgi:succinate-acetate transporter protein